MKFEKWNKTKLEDVVEINPRTPLKKGAVAKKVAMEHVKEFTRKISGFEVTEFKSGSKFINKDTLMARITPCLENGKTAYVDILEDDEVAFGSTEFFVLRPKDGKSDSKFIYYLSISEEFRKVAIQSMTGTSGRQRAQKDSLLNYELSIPSLNEQKKIGKILSLYDEKIELNNAIISNLEELAQALFKRWFVDFEFPNEEGKPYKSSGGKMVESELGMIPEGWREGVLKDITLNFDRKRVPLSKLEREKRDKIYPYYGAASLMDYVDDYIFDGIYVLVGEDGTVIDEKGYPILQYVWGKLWVNNHAHVLQGADNFTTEFIYLLLKRTNVSNIVTGAVQPKINQTNLNKIPVIIPNEIILEKFNEIINSVFTKIRNIKSENDSLEKLRDTLLPKLLSGEIKLPDDMEVTDDVPIS